MSEEWHYSRGEELVGPVSPAQLRKLAASGQLSPDDLVWKEGMADWVQARKLKGLFPAQPAADVPPPLPVSPVLPAAPPQSLLPMPIAPGFAWKEWSIGGKVIFVASCASVVSMFMAWVDTGIRSQSGLAQGGFLFLGLYVYPVVRLFQNMPMSREWGLTCSIGSVVCAVGYVGWVRSQRSELLGTVVFSLVGGGAWLFLLASIALIVGVAMYTAPGRRT